MIIYNYRKERKGENKMSIKKIIEMLLVILSIMVIFWVTASWVDVVCHNLDEHPTYQFWNFFQLMIDGKLF